MAGAEFGIGGALLVIFLHPYIISQGECDSATGRRVALIEILGSGCPKCFETERRAREAIKLAGLQARVTHVRDARTMAERGVMLMPAVAVDGTVKLSGKVPTVPELVTLWINRAAASEA